MAGTDDDLRVAAVDRALTILSVFEGQSEPLTVSELARRAGLHKSTCLRLIASLKAFGYILQLVDGRYHLGPTLLRLGTTYQRAHRIDERILPCLHELVAAGSESPSFFIRHGSDQRLCLFRVDSAHSTLDQVKTGQLSPVGRGAAGKIFAAHSAETNEVEALLILKQGYAVSFGETDPDCAAVAAPVYDHNNSLMGVLQCSGPLSRFSQEAVEEQLSLLLPAARRLSVQFGGSPSSAVRGFRRNWQHTEWPSQRARSGDETAQS